MHGVVDSHAVELKEDIVKQKMMESVALFPHAADHTNLLPGKQLVAKNDAWKTFSTISPVPGVKAGQNNMLHCNLFAHFHHQDTTSVCLISGSYPCICTFLILV